MAEILSIVSIVAFIVAGISLGLAIFFWFFFKIPDVVGDLSGRTARKSIARMRADNERTGKKTYQTGAINRVRGKLTDTMPQTAEGNAVNAVPGDGSQETALLAVTTESPGMQEFTTLLSAEPETELLEDTPKEPPARMGGKELTMVEDIVLIHTAEVIG